MPTYTKGETGTYQLVVSERGWKSLKRDLKFVTRKTTPSTFDERISKLKEIQRGWLNYFRMGSIQAKLKEIDRWLRNRLRYCIWEDWKKTERKRSNLIRLGIPTGQAYPPAGGGQEWADGPLPKVRSWLRPLRYTG